MAFNPLVHLRRVTLITWLLVCEMRWKAEAIANGLEFCGIDGKTYSTLDVNLEDDMVLHSGNCGFCSNQYDLGVLKTYSESLTSTTTWCAWAYLTLGLRAAEICMDNLVGFTLPCRNCWVENINCTVKHCMYPCMNEFFTRLLKYNFRGVREKGDRCIACDEKVCGADFASCAGANRRRFEYLLPC